MMERFRSRSPIYFMTGHARQRPTHDATAHHSLETFPQATPHASGVLCPVTVTKPRRAPHRSEHPSLASSSRATPAPGKPGRPRPAPLPRRLQRPRLNSEFQSTANRTSRYPGAQPANSPGDHHANSLGRSPEFTYADTGAAVSASRVQNAGSHSGRGAPLKSQPVFCTSPSPLGLCPWPLCASFGSVEPGWIDGVLHPWAQRIRGSRGWHERSPDRQSDTHWI